MHITNIKSYTVDLGNKRPYTIAFKTVDEVKNVFVEIELENGITGIGNGNPSEQVVGESFEACEEALTQENIQFLLGQDIRQFEQLLRLVGAQFPNSPGARCALDVALYDAFTQYLEVPLIRFLGQQQDGLPTSVTIGIKDVAETLQDATEFQSLGFRILKIKTGLDPEQDAERVRKVHEQLPEMIIRVDANQGYQPQDLERFWTEVKEVKLDMIEQPFPASTFIDQVGGLEEELQDLIAADESLVNPLDAFQLGWRLPHLGIFNIKLMKTGGIYPALQVARSAFYSGHRLMWGCNDESAASISAALHAAYAFPHTEYLDLDGSLDVIVDVVEGGFELRDGLMFLTDKPGLGIQKVQDSQSA